VWHFSLQQPILLPDHRNSSCRLSFCLLSHILKKKPKTKIHQLCKSKHLHVRLTKRHATQLLFDTTVTSLKKGHINHKWYSHQKRGFITTERSQQKDIKSKMREHKLRSGVNWQGALQQKGMKQGLGVQENSGRTACIFNLNARQ